MVSLPFKQLEKYLLSPPAQKLCPHICLMQVLSSEWRGKHLFPEKWQG